MEKLTKGMAALLSRPLQVNAPAPQVPTTISIVVRRTNLRDEDFMPPIRDLDEEDEEKHEEEILPFLKKLSSKRTHIE